MQDWISGFLMATTLAIIGWFLTWLQRKVSKQDEQRQAVAALRFELESNLGCIEDIFDTHNYLRDEALMIMKNKGYISYLRKPIPMKVIGAYDQLHRLNERIHILRETQQEVNGSFDNIEAEDHKIQLRESIKELIALLDVDYPKIGKNFREA
jgi:uncharacterized protein (DUF3084 family)